jgi:hypothetical protein
MIGEIKPKDTKEEVKLGKWDLNTLENIMTKAFQVNRIGRKIDFISRQFLGTPYSESTLIGSEKTREVFVVNLSGVDCFTFIDYVEALRLSDSFSAFKDNVIHIRYRSGIISFDHRNHFFSDWSVFNRDLIEDATMKVGGRKTQSTQKILNVKENGTLYLPGIIPMARTINYIPASTLDEPIMRKLRTGDYIGIYTDNAGLDITHVGIIIKRKGTTYLRHASSLAGYRKVIDQEFLTYMVGRPGFLVLRPKSMANRQ